MAQKTAKKVYDVLHWIENTPHHYGSWCDESGFFILKGYGNKLRIPEVIQAQTRDLVIPSPDQFDSRMFRANAKGKRLIKMQEKEK